MTMPFENTDPTFSKDSSKELVAIYKEFDFKVTYNFKRYVFLSPIEGNVDLDPLLNVIFQTPGYEAHKICYHGDKPSHIHVKYYTETNARETVDLFHQPMKVQGIRVAAILVHDFLLSLYATECLSRCYPAWTLTIVDIEGTVEYCRPLSKDMVRNLLLQFGDPRIFTYNTPGQNSPNHVQALFSSMAEALGASIAHGTWMKGDVRETSKFCYRVRLIGSEKECDVMRRFSRTPNVAAVFEMDYFVGNNLGEFNVPRVQNYPFNEQFNRQAPARPRTYTPSNQYASRGTTPPMYRPRSFMYRNPKSIPKQSKNQSVVVPDKTKGSTTSAEKVPEKTVAF